VRITASLAQTGPARHHAIGEGVRHERTARALGAPPDSADVWDVDHDEYADAESGHGTFIAGLIVQVVPAAEVSIVKVLDSHGVGDDAAVATAMEQLPQDVDIVNLSLGGYTGRDARAHHAAQRLDQRRRRAGAPAADSTPAPQPDFPLAVLVDELEP
jgi:subtilisin family serine protease